MTPDLKELMAARTDDELITILFVRSEDYIPEALSAARSEFEKRSISGEKLAEIELQQRLKKERETARASEPLEPGIKMLAIISPLLAMILYSGKFNQGGYKRKLAEMSRAFFVGRLILVGIVLLVIILAKFL